MTKKTQFTVYLDPDTEEKLQAYCQIAVRNRIRVINDAIREYVSIKLRDEFIKEGLLK